AQVWAALRMTFSQAEAEPNLALKVENRLLVMKPALFWPRTVPSGTKLRVTSCGLGQAFPLTEAGASRDSNSSSRGRAPAGRTGRPAGPCVLLFLKNVKNPILLPLDGQRPGCGRPTGDARAPIPPLPAAGGPALPAPDGEGIRERLRPAVG